MNKISVEDVIRDVGTLNSQISDTKPITSVELTLAKRILQDFSKIQVDQLKNSQAAGLKREVEELKRKIDNKDNPAPAVSKIRALFCRALNIKNSHEKIKGIIEEIMAVSVVFSHIAPIGDVNQFGGDVNGKINRFATVARLIDGLQKKNTRKEKERRGRKIKGLAKE